jgi:hypothetical protein
VRQAWLTCFLVAGVMFPAGVFSIPARAADASYKPVDSGSFGIFNGSRRVATETFSIKQGAEGSIITSEFQSAQGEQTADQSSELDLTGSVELRRYEWKELSPEKVNAVVEPGDSMLIEHVFAGPSEKPQDQKFLLTPTTSILDDYFFIQREVLAWKFLAMACKQQAAGLSCPSNQPLQMGTLNPHARSSMLVSIEFSGKDKIVLKGAQRELSRFALKCETGNWEFWLDESYKLVRLLGDNGIEVVRD